MSPEISERSFEEAIACALLQHGPDLPADGSGQAGACAGEAGDSKTLAFKSTLRWNMK